MVLSSLLLLFTDAAKSFLKHNVLPLFFILILVSLPLIIRKLYPYRDKSRAIPVLLLAIVYIQILLIFSVVYYSIYLFDASSFVFAGPLEDKQATGFFTSRYALVQEKQRHLYNIALWKQWILSHSDTDFDEARKVCDNYFPTPSGFEFAPGHRLLLDEYLPRDTAVFIYQVVFTDGTKKYTSKAAAHLFNLFSPEMEIVCATNRLEHVNAFGPVERKLSGEIDRLLAEIRGSGRTWPLWGYLEFVYFSACVSTTASYGDIIPNSGLVRFLTTTQVITLLFLLTFGLTIFLPSRKRES